MPQVEFRWILLCVSQSTYSNYQFLQIFYLVDVVVVVCWFFILCWLSLIVLCWILLSYSVTGEVANCKWDQLTKVGPSRESTSFRACPVAFQCSSNTIRAPSVDSRSKLRVKFMDVNWIVCFSQLSYNFQSIHENFTPPQQLIIFNPFRWSCDCKDHTNLAPKLEDQKASSCKAEDEIQLLSESNLKISWFSQLADLNWTAQLSRRLVRLIDSTLLQISSLESCNPKFNSFKSKAN